ncbi:MAG: tetratricopeptide repeat protein [Blastocatellia bacterium]
MAVLLKKQGQLAEAAQLYQRALAIFAKTLDPQHPKVITCRENYVRLQRQSTR